MIVSLINSLQLVLGLNSTHRSTESFAAYVVVRTTTRHLRRPVQRLCSLELNEDNDDPFLYGPNEDNNSPLHPNEKRSRLAPRRIAIYPDPEGDNGPDRICLSTPTVWMTWNGSINPKKFLRLLKVSESIAYFVMRTRAIRDTDTG